MATRDRKTLLRTAQDRSKPARGNFRTTSGPQGLLQRQLSQSHRTPLRAAREHFRPSRGSSQNHRTPLRAARENFRPSREPQNTVESRTRTLSALQRQLPRFFGVTFKSLSSYFAMSSRHNEHSSSKEAAAVTVCGNACHASLTVYLPSPLRRTSYVTNPRGRLHVMHRSSCRIAFLELQSYVCLDSCANPGC